MKKAKFKTKSPALKKLTKMVYGDNPPSNDPKLDLKVIFELAYRLKKGRHSIAQTDQQSFAA